MQNSSQASVHNTSKGGGGATPQKKEEEKFEELKFVYEKIGYTIKKISVEKDEGLTELTELLKNKTTLISGHSGVGKSSF